MMTTVSISPYILASLLEYKSKAKLTAVAMLFALVAACAPAPASAPPAAEATTAPTEAATAAPAATSAPDSATAEPATSASTLPSGQHTYIIDPEKSSASYIVNEQFFGLALPKYGIAEGLSDTVGTTNKISGQFQFNWDDLNAPLGDNTFTVDLSTLKSNQGLRDSWIRENGPQFGAHPNATFVAESIEGAPASYTPGDEVNFKMNGQLTIHETTKPATWDITAVMQDGVIRGTATTNLKMSDFGITPPDFANTLTVQDDFKVKVDFVAQE